METGTLLQRLKMQLKLLRWAVSFCTSNYKQNYKETVLCMRPIANFLHFEISVQIFVLSVPEPISLKPVCMYGCAIFFEPFVFGLERGHTYVQTLWSILVKCIQGCSKWIFALNFHDYNRYILPYFNFFFCIGGVCSTNKINLIK